MPDPAALALMLLLWPTGEAAACRVTAVSDGDTARLSCAGLPERRTRLHCIDAPENWPRKTPEGEAAKAHLETLLRGELRGEVIREDDGFGRRVVSLSRYSDGATIAGLMVEAGHAEWVTEPRFGCAEPVRPRARQNGGSNER